MFELTRLFEKYFFFVVTVVDGRLEFSYELGSGSVQITTPVRVDDGKRHRAVARRTSREGSLELDSIIQENGRSPEGVHQMLNTKGNIYIGKRAAAAGDNHDEEYCVIVVLGFLLLLLFLYLFLLLF